MLSEQFQLWKLALPLALAQAGQALMGLVDTAVLGRLSAAAQAGAGLGNSLTFTCTFFGMGVMLALDPLVSQAFGGGHLARARGYFWQGVWLALLTSVMVATAVALLTYALEPMGVAPSVASGARTLMWWRLPGLPAVLLFVTTRSYLAGTGRVTAIFISMVVANVVNAVLVVVLVFGYGPIPQLGVPGAALATVVSSWLQVIGLLVSLGKAPIDSVSRPDPIQIFRLFSIGAPIGLQFLAESSVFSLTGVFAGRLGEHAGAAHQVALNWASLTFCMATGIGSAASTRVGWAIGRGDTAAARHAGLNAFLSVALFMALASLAFGVFPEAMAGMMSNDDAVIAQVLALFAVVAVFQISDGLQAVGAGALRGLGETKFTFWANFGGHFGVGLPVAYFLGVMGTRGVVGLWWGLSAGLSTVALALVLRFTRATQRAVARL
jgi:MATE family multidrug resistance protein